MQLCPAPNVRKGHLNQAWRNIPSKKNSHASAVQMSACPVAQEKPTISKAPETSEWTSRAVSPKVGTRNKTQSDPARHAVTCFSANVLLYIYIYISTYFPSFGEAQPNFKAEARGWQKGYNRLWHQCLLVPGIEHGHLRDRHQVLSKFSNLDGAHSTVDSNKAWRWPDRASHHMKNILGCSVNKYGDLGCWLCWDVKPFSII